LVGKSHRKRITNLVHFGFVANLKVNEKERKNENFSNLLKLKQKMDKKQYLDKKVNRSQCI